MLYSRMAGDKGVLKVFGIISEAFVFVARVF